MFFDDNLFVKPVFWGSADLKYLDIIDDRLVIGNQKKDLSPACQLAKSFLLEKSQELNDVFSAKDTESLKIFYLNLANLIQKSHSCTILKVLKDLGRFFHILPSDPLEDLAQLVFKAINEREIWYQPKLKTFVPSKIKRKLSFSNNHHRKIANIYKKYIYIRNYFIQDHVVCILAQSTYLNIYTDLIKEVHRLQSPHHNLKNFKFLRLPPQSEEYQNLNEFDNYIRKKTGARFDDQSCKDEVISLDIYDENIEDYESAYDYLRNNTNSQNPVSILQNELDKYLASYPLSAEKIESIQSKIEQIKQQFNRQPKIGNLILICVPKKWAFSEKSPFWLSWHYGIPLQVKPEISFKKVVELLQSRKLKQAQKYLLLNKRPLGRLRIPQGRLLAYLLKPERGVKIFRINSLKKDFKKSYKSQIKEIAKELFSTQKAHPDNDLSNT